jgi:hypothetical protein
LFIFLDNPNGIAINLTTANKMGHIFGIFHTIHGDAIYNKNTGDDNACQELLNYKTSNVCICRDYVRDTPSDDGVLIAHNPDAK